MPVPEGVVEEIKAHETDKGVLPAPKLPPPFARGDALEVREGPFRDQVGFFECVSDDERIVILLSMLGRQIRIPRWQGWAKGAKEKLDRMMAEAA